MSIAAALDPSTLALLDLGGQKLHEIISLVVDKCKKEEDIHSAQPEKEPKREIEKVIKKSKKPLIKKEDKLSFMRGKRIFEICQTYPFLQEQASCRKPEANLKRNQIWKIVTAQLNEEFDGVVGYEPINASQAKKFEEYYRRRCQPDTPLSPELLAVIGQTSVAPPPPRNLRHHQCLDVEKLREQRLFFMVILIKEVMKHTGLDKICHERSWNTNERRQAMWKFVTVTVNNRYFERLDILIEAQVKKSFSNYKRRHPEFLEGTGICEAIDGEGLEVTDVEMQEMEECHETISSPKLENFVSDFTQTVAGKDEMNNVTIIGNEKSSVQ